MVYALGDVLVSADSLYPASRTTPSSVEHWVLMAHCYPLSKHTLGLIEAVWLRG